MEKIDNRVAYSPSEAAKVLGVSKPTIYNLINSNCGFPSFKIGERRLINARALAEWVDKQTFNEGR